MTSNEKRARRGRATLNGIASSDGRAVDPDWAAPRMRLVAAECRERDGRWGRGQHHRDIARDGGEAEQAAAGFVVLVAAVGLPRNAVVRVTVDGPVAMLVHSAGVRVRLGFCGMDVGRDRRVTEARRIGAERHGRMRGKDAKRVSDGERQRGRETAPPDRFEYRRHPRIFALRQIASFDTIQGRPTIANRRADTTLPINARQCPSIVIS